MHSGYFLLPASAKGDMVDNRGNEESLLFPLSAKLRSWDEARVQEEYVALQSQCLASAGLLSRGRACAPSQHHPPLCSSGITAQKGDPRPQGKAQGGET